MIQTAVSSGKLIKTQYIMRNVAFQAALGSGKLIKTQYVMSDVAFQAALGSGKHDCSRERDAS